MLRVGMIGHRNHAARLAQVVEESGLARVAAYYHPTKALSLPGATRCLQDLLGLDAVVVASPNETHSGYLSFLSESYDGYVFCEKPPVSNNEQFAKLALDPAKTYFNFNYRFSRLAEVIEQAVSEGHVGRPISINACSTNGLAFKAGYENSWRGGASQHPHSILETKAIHFLDLAVVFLGQIEKYTYCPRNASGCGRAFDSCSVMLEHANGATSSVFTSYAAPLRLEFALIGTEGAVEFRDDVVRILSPRDTFDSSGKFVTPPVVSEYRYEPRLPDMYSESLQASVCYFLNTCRSKGTFPKSSFEMSLATNRLVLDMVASHVV